MRIALWIGSVLQSGVAMWALIHWIWWREGFSHNPEEFFIPIVIGALPCLAIAHLITGGSPGSGWLRLLLERKRLEEQRRIRDLRGILEEGNRESVASTSVPVKEDEAIASMEERAFDVENALMFYSHDVPASFMVRHLMPRNKGVKLFGAFGIATLFARDSSESSGWRVIRREGWPVNLSLDEVSGRARAWIKKEEEEEEKKDIS